MIGMFRNSILDYEDAFYILGCDGCLDVRKAALWQEVYRIKSRDWDWTSVALPYHPGALEHSTEPPTTLGGAAHILDNVYLDL